MSATKDFFDDIIEMIQNAPKFLGNVHLNINQFLMVKRQVNKASALLAFTEQEKQDLLKTAKHINLIFAFARRELQKCKKCFQAKDNIVCSDILDYLIQASQYLAEISGFCETNETIQRVQAELTPSEENIEEENVWSSE
jgi:hypothetical protein